MLSKPILVEMTRFELATSTSRTWRSTKLSHISLMIFSLFSVSGQTCGQTTYIGIVIELIIAQKCSVFKGFRRFCKFYARNRQFAPEPCALPNCATPRNRPYYYSTVAKVCQYIFWRNHNLPQKLRTICGFTVFVRCCKYP